MVNKRAQFFLLAAVIISVVVISLGFSENWAKIRNEPDSFYDFSYEVERETGAVLDYDIYTSFDGNADLDNFVNLLADDISDTNPDTNFVIVYGDEDGVEIQNHGEDSIEVSVLDKVVVEELEEAEDQVTANDPVPGSSVKKFEKFKKSVLLSSIKKFFGLKGKKEKTSSSVSLDGHSAGIEGQASDYDRDVGEVSLEDNDVNEGDLLLVEMGEGEVSFPVSSSPKVVFVVQKDVGDESYVAA
jgi:hypothetical protein